MREEEEDFRIFMVVGIVTLGFSWKRKKKEVDAKLRAVSV